MIIDCYGHTSNSIDYRTREGRPAEIDASTEGVTYIRYGITDQCAIHRIATSNGVTTLRWTYGAWASRESFEYTATLDESLEVE